MQSRKDRNKMSKSKSVAKLWAEWDKVCELVSMWLIMLGENVVGQIAVRHSSSGRSDTVILKMTSGEKHSGIIDYKRMTGYGYNRVQEGIRDILYENREKLKDYYGIVSQREHSMIFSKWEQDIEQSGYSVISVA